MESDQPSFKGDEFINNPNVVVMPQPHDNTSAYGDNEVTLETAYHNNTVNNQSIVSYEDSLLHVDLQSDSTDLVVPN